MFIECVMLGTKNYIEKNLCSYDIISLLFSTLAIGKTVPKLLLDFCEGVRIATAVSFDDDVHHQS